MLHEGGFDQLFAGEVAGLISAGAFVSFGASAAVTDASRAGGWARPFEGMLPVRGLRGRGDQREWWELNEQGTILSGERSGATLRLGDPIEVRVARVEAIRGRVDLLPTG